MRERNFRSENAAAETAGRAGSAETEAGLHQETSLKINRF